MCTVWVQLSCAFRYGNEDLDVVGLIFKKDIWINHIQLYPEAGHKPQLTDMHNTLLKKAGEQAYAFTINVHSHTNTHLQYSHTHTLTHIQTFTQKTYSHTLAVFYQDVI